MRKKPKKRYLFCKKFRNVSVQTNSCNPMRILIEQIKAEHIKNRKECAEICESIEDLRYQGNELQSLVNLFQLSLIRMIQEEHLDDIPMPEDPEERALTCELINLKKSLNDARTKRCELLKELHQLENPEIKENLANKRKTQKLYYHWDCCLGDFIKIDQDPRDLSPKKYSKKFDKNVDCYGELSATIMKLMQRNAAVVQVLVKYRQVLQILNSNDSWTPQLYVGIKNFLKSQVTNSCELMKEITPYEYYGGPRKVLPNFLRHPNNKLKKNVWR